MCPVNQKMFLKSVATVLKLLCAFALMGSVIIGGLSLQVLHGLRGACLYVEIFTQEVLLLSEA